MTRRRSFVYRTGFAAILSVLAFLSAPCHVFKCSVSAFSTSQLKLRPPRHRCKSLLLSSPNVLNDRCTQSSFSAVSLQSQRNPTYESGKWYRSTTCTNNNFVACLLIGLLSCPLPAQAGFGPTGGATTTPTPGLSEINVQVQDLNQQRKLQQLIGTTLDGRRLEEFQAQLDSLIESTITSIDQEEGSAIETIQSKEEELEKARVFQAQVIRRENILDALEAQPWWFNYFAAFCGSVASTLVMHPVDTIKTRVQASSTNSTGKEKLFSNLYEGLSGNILKEGPPSALYLGVYESVKSSLLSGRFASSVGASVNPTYLLSIYLLSGAAGEFVGSAVRAPAESIKTMVQTKAAKTVSEAFHLSLSNRAGQRNIFRAWSASVLRDVPFGAVQLALFELIKAYILNNPNIDFDSGTLQAEAIIGAIAGATGAFLTTPTDVIVTRIITQSTGQIDGTTEPLGVIGTGKRIYQEGGLSAFFAGWQARVLYWGPAISLFLTCYCSVRQLGVKFDLFS